MAKELILTGVKISLPDIACASLVEAIHTLDKLHVGLLRAARVGGEEPEAGNATIPAKSAADEPDRYDERHEMASGTTVDAATVVADFVSAFDKELISIAGTLRSNVPFEDCQKEARTFIDRFAGDRDHPRWANMPLGENYSFINDVPAYNDSPAFSWLFPNGLSSAAANFWFPVVQNLSRFLYFRGTPRQQAKMREQLLEAADDYLDASGYENSEPAVAKLASGNLGQKGPKEPPAPNEATGSDIHAAIIKLAQVLGDENAGKILAITQDSDKTVEEKLRLMSALDRRFKGEVVAATRAATGCQRTSHQKDGLVENRQTARRLKSDAWLWFEASTHDGCRLHLFTQRKQGKEAFRASRVVRL
ncbi:MAG: hypothetical protein ABI614_26625 [Planctomycetota bacterium]